MTIEDKQLEFIIYCVESTAERLGRYGSEVYNKLKELGAINGYIRSYYDTLHTQGKSYIVDSLLEYIYYRDPIWLPKEYQPFRLTNEKKGGTAC
ncbi:MAG: DUF3791 domain-containing protein [Bacteroides sp.]|nr:DUF3791 domain-containing protein [Bacteroides sp.]